jgi:hypothetical protein
VGKVTVAKRNTEDLTQQIDKLMQTREDLDPALAMYLDHDGPFGPSIKHPLVFSMIHSPVMNAFVNAQLKAKKKALKKAKSKGDWDTCVWLYERPYRLNAFLDVSWHLDGPRYWDLLGSVWSDTENSWQNREAWREAFTADAEGREMMSDEDVRCVFDLPPEKGGLLPMTRIYRGYRFGDALQGFSWTLDKARARWFAERLRQDDHPSPKIASGYVAREHVIAYITGRDEQEIVTLPEHVTQLEIEEV